MDQQSTGAEDSGNYQGKSGWRSNEHEPGSAQALPCLYTHALRADSRMGRITTALNPITSPLSFCYHAPAGKLAKDLSIQLSEPELASLRIKVREVLEIKEL